MKLIQKNKSMPIPLVSGFVICLLMAIYSFPSYSAALEVLKPESKSCKTYEGRTQYLNEIIKTYEVELLGKIESVPPESSDYLAKEYNAAIKTGNEARFNLLQGNKYYHAWRLASSVNDLKDKANQSYWFYSNKKKSETMKYVEVLEAQHKVREEFSEYAAFDNNRTPRVLQQKDNNRLYFSLLALTIPTRTLIECVLDN